MDVPAAADLTSKRVQSYSDQELFWIVQNGIRFTGMPGFGKVEPPDHIWDLVNYVRTFAAARPIPLVPPVMSGIFVRPSRRVARTRGGEKSS